MQNRTKISLITLTTCVGLLLCALLFGRQVHANSDQGLKLKVDNTPLSNRAQVPASFADVVKQVSPSVVNIYSTKIIKANPYIMPFFDDPFLRRFFGFDLPQRQQQQRSFKEQSLGSGVIVTEDGYILTNNHVVDGADEIKIILYNNEEFDAKVVGKDPQTDVAVLKVDAKKLPAATLGDSSVLEVGDIVLAIGNPFGLGHTVTMGIVSAKGRSNLGIVNYEDFIQTDASINPGNSGGALVDVKGRLIGINTAIFSRTGGNMGIGFAIPINLAKDVMSQILETGKVRRGYLGILLQPITAKLAKEFGLSDKTGALVSEVSQDSPAEKAGIKPGDVIVEFDGKKIEDANQLRWIVAKTKPGANVEVRIIRDGKQKTLQVKVGDWPSELQSAAIPGKAPSSKGDLFDGVELSELDRNTRNELDVPRNITGVVVTDIDPECPAYKAEGGLRVGDVITEIDRKPVRSLDDAYELSRNIKRNSVLLRVWNKNGSRWVLVDLDSSK